METVDLYWNPLWKSTLAIMKYDGPSSVSLLSNFINGQVEEFKDDKYVIAHCNTGFNSPHKTNLVLYPGDKIARQSNGTYVKVSKTDINTKFSDYEFIHTFIVKDGKVINSCKVI